MSLLKTQLVCDDKTSLEENEYRNDDDKLSKCIRRPNARSAVENSDTETGETRDFRLRGKAKK